MRCVKIVSGPEYRIDGKLQNLPIFGISIVFEIENILS